MRPRPIPARLPLKRNSKRAGSSKAERTLVPAASSQGGLRVHLVYPNTYYVGMSSLGFQRVYALLADQPGVAVERVFLPESPGQEWRTHESSRTLPDCDVIAFSASFELDYFHVLEALRSSHLLFKDAATRLARTELPGSRFPLLLIGGTAVTLNPEPLADFFDVIALGEA